MQARLTKLEEINGLPKDFLGPENMLISEGDLVEIIENMAPAQWCQSMVQIKFEPTQKTLTEVVEYFESLDVLDSTKKKSENKTKFKSKGNRTGRNGN